MLNVNSCIPVPVITIPVLLLPGIQTTAQELKPSELKKLSIEELTNPEVTGLYVSAMAGTFIKDNTELRWGGKIGNKLFCKIYGQHFDRNLISVVGHNLAQDRHTEFGNLNTPRGIYAKISGRF